MRRAAFRDWSTAALLLAVLLAASGCDSSGENGGGGTFDGDAQAILENEARGVLRATYENLAANTDTLQSAVQGLAEMVSETTLGDAQAAWRGAHRPWKQSEAFRLGPVADLEARASLDHWPADAAGIQDLLDGDAPITEARVAALDTSNAGARRGFHAVEFVLFGAGGEKTMDDLTPRETTYLTAAAGVLADRAQVLADASGGAADALAGAGTGGSPYESDRAALDSLASSMAAVAGAVGEKIGLSLEDTTRLRIESAYSMNAFVDLRNTLRGLRHVYTGDYDGREGLGLDEIVRDVRPALDEQMRRQTARAIARLRELNETAGSFRAAVQEEQDALRAARNAARDLRETVQQELRPLVAGLQLRAISRSASRAKS